MPDIDSRSVVCVEGPTPSGRYRIELDDGEHFLSDNIVLATGIANAAYVPPEFFDVPRHLAFHSSKLRYPKEYVGKRVLVVGGGQSAIESAALLHEAGADVEVLARRPITWLLGYDDGTAGRLKHVLHSEPWKTWLYPPQDVGPIGINQIVTRPKLFRTLAAFGRTGRTLQRRMAYRAGRPAASNWLRSRVADVRMTIGRRVVRVAPHASGLFLTLDDGSTRAADSVLLATGYRVHLSQYSFLHPRLMTDISTHGDGLPRLTPRFELVDRRGRPIPGLYMVGAPAAESNGPMFRFVSGAAYAAREISRSIRSRLDPSESSPLQEVWQQREFQEAG